MTEAIPPSKRAAFGPVSHRVDSPSFGRRPRGELEALGGPKRPELHSSTVLYVAAAFFAITATVAGLAAGGTLLPHHAAAMRLELRGTLPADDSVPSH